MRVQKSVVVCVFPSVVVIAVVFSKGEGRGCLLFMTWIMISTWSSYCIFVEPMIEEPLLRQYGASEREYGKNDVIFMQGDHAIKYYQVGTGEVKMNNYNDEGKEFIQGLFSDGRSFGEPPLFSGFEYPANAVALKPTTLLALEKGSFFRLLKEHPEVHLKFTGVLAKRLHYKAMMVAEISSEEADHRILTLIDYFKQTIDQVHGAFSYEVKLTRQQIADLTGLRVETVIRTVKKLESEAEIKIIDRKIWR